MAAKSFKSGDIVWVQPSKRLGWWPGQVENVSTLREDLRADVTDETIAVVKYLNEDNYQFVEDCKSICAYNSAAKDEYITLGMKKYFEKKRLNESSSTFMKFPIDVRQAEKLTGGDPDITELEKYNPKKTPAQNKYKDIFVDPNAKDKSPKVSTPLRGGGRGRGRGRGRGSASNTNSPSNVSPVRSQAQSDHEVRIRRQASPTSSPKSTDYTCDFCSFTTARLNVIIQHRKTHSAAETPKQSGGKKRTKSPAKKTVSKKRKSAAVEEEEEVEEVKEDLFDVVKRHLEEPATRKTTAKTPTRTAKGSAKTEKSKTPNRNANKSQLCPKKKWLKSSQKECNPELKNKLMADWEEDDEEKEQPVTSAPDDDRPLAYSDSDDEGFSTSASKFGVLQHRSDDEDDEDMELDKNERLQMDNNQSSPLRPVDDVEAHPNDKNDRKESLADISAEIDKLNAEMEHIKPDSSSKDSEEPKVAEVVEKAPTETNHVAADEVTTNGSTAEDDRMKENIALLLAETTVPDLSDVVSVKRKLEAPELESPKLEESAVEGSALKEPIVEGSIGEELVEDPSNSVSDEIKNAKNELTAAQEEEVATEEVTTGNPTASSELPQDRFVAVGDASAVVGDAAVHCAEEGEPSGATNNILMQVEGGETYMVVWEPGSNIQELLTSCDDGTEDSETPRTALIIDPSSLPATELENLFQIAVQADSNGAVTETVEESNQTVSSIAKDPKSGENSCATSTEMQCDTVIWAKIDGRLFMPAGVLETEGRNQVIVALFDVARPENKRKFHRQKIIPYFHDTLNMELLEFGRKRKKVSEIGRLNKAYDHAHEFHQLKQTKLPLLNVRQYLNCCFQSPFKLFSDRYLNRNPDDFIGDLPEAIDDDCDHPQASEEELQKKLQLVQDILEEHVLTDSCLNHLKEYVNAPSDAIELYRQRKWKQLSLISTVGIFEKSKTLYCKLADFLTDNVTRVMQLTEGRDNKRAFILDVLLPEGLRFGVQEMLKVSPVEASNIVMYGIKNV